MAAELKTKFRQGVPVRVLADFIGRCEDTVYSLLKEVGVKVHPRLTGAARAALAASLKTRHEAGASIRALADETGYCKSSIRALLAVPDVPAPGAQGSDRSLPDDGTTHSTTPPPAP